MDTAEDLDKVEIQIQTIKSLNMEKRIAVPVDENIMLDAHFGHCKYFALFEIENDKIVSVLKVQPPPHEPGVLPKWLADKNVTDVIAGGMGQKEIQIFNHNKVNVFVGAPKLTASEIVSGFMDKTIEFNANYCDH